MSASRFFIASGAAIFRNHNRPLSSLPSLRFTKSLPVHSLRFLSYRLYSSSAGGIDTVVSAETTEIVDSSHHPWPEWVTFIDRLKSRGYFMKRTLEGDVSSGNGGEIVVDYKDMNVLKDACLSFARDRYDVFKSLSIKEMQTVVEVGCPNLFRKAVNSGKRLRAHVQLDEGEVCSTCNLRGSCDRAYVILKESEADARTVDIVRILMFYALDPLISGENKAPGRILVEASARKLLSELVELSDASPNPAPPKPAAKASRKKEQSINTIDDELSQDVEMKKGDWMCPSCNFLNFSRNAQCLKCKEDKPKIGDDVEMKKGDWTCPECSFMNFSRNIKCLKCSTEGPKRVGADEVEMKKGDWNCSQCGFMNFASNKKCLRCRESRPQREMNPGEWECPSCDFLNYRRNKVCKRCNRDHPNKATSEYEEQIWTRPQ